MAMELKIYNPTDAGFITRIEWNYEELKAQITEASESYATSIYTDDSIKAAKADRAKLRKFQDALKTKRTEIRKRLLEPDEQFGKEITELVAIVGRAIDNIDLQVKGYEARQREEKLGKVRELYEDIFADLKDAVPEDRAILPEYGNATKTLKSVREELTALAEKVRTGLRTIDETDTPYQGDMREVFLRTFDIGAAMIRRNKLEQEAEARRIYEEKRKQEAAARMEDLRAQVEANRNAGRLADPEPVREPIRQGIDAKTDDTPELPKKWVAFEALLDKHKAGLLKAFFRNNGIEFRSVRKEDK